MNTQTDSIEEEIIDKMIHDRDFRISLVTKSHYWFFHYYFGPNYVRYRTADFQREILNLTENLDIKNLVILAFRGSAKSTLITLSYVIWSIVGVQQKKFPVILGQTQFKAQGLLHAIKHEFEHNERLKDDLGLFREENNQWGAQSLILPKYGAKISTGSVEQSIRGIRHHEHRPDLIVCDDLEDQDSVRTQENRDKLFEWLTGDVIPAGDMNTRMIFIGTPLHNDSILMRLEKIFESGDTKNVFRKYPIVDENGKALWLGKFPTAKELDDEKAKCFNELSWLREYMLKIVESEYQIIKREHIHYYTSLPAENPRFAALSIDPARSQKETADYTAMVSGKLYGYDRDRKLYILPDPVKARLTSDQLLTKAKNISGNLGNGYYSRVYVEDVNFQGVFVDLLKAEGIPAKPFPVRGWSKEDRLMAISSLVELGRIIFPNKGCEELIEQMLGFGIEKHDDLVDALTMLVLQIFEDTRLTPSIRVFSYNKPYSQDDEIDRAMGISNAHWKPLNFGW